MRLDVGYIRSSTVPAQAASLYNDPGMAAMSRGDALKLSVRLGGSYTVRAATTVPTLEVIIEYVPEANTSAIPRIEPVTHPDPDGWYNIATAELTWTLPVDITTVRTLLNGSPSSVPTKVYETPINSITLTDLDEGVSYFHIQFRNSDGWGNIRHCRLAVDTAAPTDLKITRASTSNVTNPAQILTFSVTAETSGIVRYLI
jgi:hypothetical protein